MIRRRIEYMIFCDGEQVFRKPMCDATWHAFDSETAKDCAESAKAEGWKQISPKLWLCPECKVHLKESE